jgi:hypothetical protein
MLHQREEWIDNAHEEFDIASHTRPHREVLHEISTAFLTIHNTQVTSEYSNIIRHEATSPQAIKYLTEKHKWSFNTFRDIHWEAHGKAISSLPGRQYKTTTQFIHQWLPVNASYSKTSIGTARLCPYCLSCEETQEHFLSCTHDGLQKAWQTAAETVVKKIQRYNNQTSHYLLRLLSLSITTWRCTKQPTRPKFLPPHLYALFDKQSLIGWDQILMGRFSRIWTSTTESHRMSTNWLTFAIRTLWQQFYEVWITRCNRTHGEDTNTKRRMALLRLSPQVELLYQQMHVIPNTEQYIFQKTKEETLNLPTFALENWIFKAKIRLKAMRAREAKTKQGKTIHPFFLSQSSKYKLKKKVQKSQHQGNGRRAPIKRIATTITKFFTYKHKTQLKSLHLNNDLFPP